MEKGKSPTRSRAVLASGVVLGVLALTTFGVIAAIDTTRPGNIDIDDSGHSVETSFENDRQAVRKLAKILLANEKRRRETHAMLRELDEVEAGHPVPRVARELALMEE